MHPLHRDWQGERIRGTRFSLGLIADDLARYIEEVAGAGMDDTAALLRMAHLDLLAKVNAIELEEFRAMATLNQVPPEEGADFFLDDPEVLGANKPVRLAPVRLLQPLAHDQQGTFRDTRLHQALEIWQGLLGSGKYPTRTAMTPRLMSGFLRQVCLLQVDAKSGGFMVRVCGDAIEHAWGRSLAGLVAEDLNQLSAGTGDGLRQICHWLLEFAQPLIVEDVLLPEANGARRECLFLPLGDSELALDHVVAVLGAVRQG